MPQHSKRRQEQEVNSRKGRSSAIGGVVKEFNPEVIEKPDMDGMKLLPNKVRNELLMKVVRVKFSQITVERSAKQVRYSNEWFK